MVHCQLVSFNVNNVHNVDGSDASFDSFCALSLERVPPAAVSSKGGLFAAVFSIAI